MANDEDTPEEKDTPNVLDTEDGEEEENGASRQKDLAHSKDIHATRDEVVAEALTKSSAQASEEDEDEDHDDEIDSARAELRESAEEEEDEDDEEDEEDDDGANERSSYYQRVIERVNGQEAEKLGNLKVHLTGDIVVSVTDKKEGLHLAWKKNVLGVSRWSDSPPDKPTCLIELSEKNLEEILRGRLNPQIAMLSHKVHISGELSHAIYFFNLFQKSSRRS